MSFAINAELIPPIRHEVIEPVGIDVNPSDGKYCVLSDGTTVTYPKPLTAAITKLRSFQYHNRNKKFGDRSKGISTSNNARKYFNSLAKLHKQIADRRNDFLQKLTTDLARKYKHYGRHELGGKPAKTRPLKLETLNIQGMMANHKLAFHIADVSFYKFKFLL